VVAAVLPPVLAPASAFSAKLWGTSMLNAHTDASAAGCTTVVGIAVAVGAFAGVSYDAVFTPPASLAASPPGKG
jgi:hypothetical protein